MAVRVGRWDCTTCGHIGNLGPKTRCDNCGAPRPENVRFYLPTDAEIVKDEERLREAKAGVDWICGHCTSQNKAADTICNSCGNPRDELSEDIDLQEREYSLDEVPTDSFKRERTIHPLERPQPRRSRVGNVGKLFLGGFILFIVAIFMLRSFPKEIEVTVEQFEWKRTLQMLHYEAVQHEDWNVPSKAFDVSSFRAVHHYDQVLRGYETRTRTVRVKVGTETYVCGQIDKGNGYFEDKYCTRNIYENRQETYEEPVYDQVPVYATKYRYKLMEWVSHPQNLLRASGQNHEAQWPAPKAGQRTPSDRWREGPKTEEYHIFVREDDGDVHKEKVTYNFWSGLRDGQKIKAKKSRMFDVWYGLEVNQ